MSSIMHIIYKVTTDLNTILFITGTRIQQFQPEAQNFAEEFER